jgi:hypothetical protein|tara:strand:+ start:4362 stop:4493 length:132 start_codon:yes stop_codon:yes gene_type:complete
VKDDKSILDVIDDDEMKASADSGEFDKQKDTQEMEAEEKLNKA